MHISVVVLKMIYMAYVFTEMLYDSKWLGPAV